MTTTKFLVPAMTCGHCTSAVTEELKKISGVVEVEIDLETKQVTVDSSIEIEWQDVVEAIDEAGFEAVKI